PRRSSDLHLARVHLDRHLVHHAPARVRLAEALGAQERGAVTVVFRAHGVASSPPAAAAWGAGASSLGGAAFAPARSPFLLGNTVDRQRTRPPSTTLRFSSR